MKNGIVAGIVTAVLLVGGFGLVSQSRAAEEGKASFEPNRLCRVWEVAQTRLPNDHPDAPQHSKPIALPEGWQPIGAWGGITVIRRCVKR